MRAPGPLRLLLLALWLTACAAARAPEPSQKPPLRVSELLDAGDPTRRASMRIVESGLAAEASGGSQRALPRYERAIRIDPTNPFAYLALSRHYVERGDPSRALEVLEQAQLLLDAEGEETPRVEAHLDGLRGAALVLAGRSFEGQPLLDRAAQRAPSVWADGVLDAAELR